VRVGRAEPLPPAAEHAFFRVAQEALANVLRHSGASKVVVDLAGDEPGRAALTVTDDGKGLEEGPAGMGLGNMRARVEELPGGRFDVTTAAGGGTRVEASCDTNGAHGRS
jgi:signal transduction histidine kinase